MSIIPRTRTRLAVLSLIAVLTACESSRDTSQDYLAKAQSYFDEGDLIKAKIEVRNSIQVEPKNAGARFLLAQINELEQDVRGSLQNLLIVVEADPGHVDARLKLGRYYVLGRRAEEAGEQVAALQELAPDDARVRLLNARLALLNGDALAAFDEGERALRLDPEFVEAASFVALMHARAGDLDRAMGVIDRAIEVADVPGIETLRANRISILAEAGERGRGRAELEAMARDYPDERTYQLALAELHMAAGEIPEAEKLIGDLIAGDPDDVQLRVQLATLLSGQGYGDKAEESLKRALARNPDSKALQFALAAFFESRDRDAEAVAIYESIAKAESRSADGLAARNRLVALQIDDDLAAARSAVDQILADAPDNPDALRYRAAFRIQDGELDQAVGDLRAALARQPASEESLLALARVYVLKGKPVLAEDAYRRLLSGNPANKEGIAELATLAGNRGEHEEAETLLRRAMRLGPEDADVSRNLVKALLLQDDFEAAEVEARRMVDLGENTGIASYQLGVALEAQGESGQAEAAYRAALAKTPTADEPLIALVRLLVRNGKTDAAVEYLEAHRQSHPDHQRAALLLGEAYAAGGDTERARQHFGELVAAQPGEPAAWIALAGLAAPESDARLAVLRDGLDRNPGNVRLGLALGSTHEKRSEYEQAIAVYDETLSDGGDDDLLVNNLAALLLDFRTDAESHRRALELARRFEARASHPFSVAVLGWAHYRNGDYERAARYLERAVAASQQVPQLRYYLGMAYLKVANEVGARQELRKAIESTASSGGSFQGLDEARAALAELEAAGSG